MRIGIDFRANDPSYRAHFGRGTGRYARGLFESLPRVAGDLSVKYCSSEDMEPKGVVGALAKTLPFGRVTLSTQFLLPRRVRSLEVDALHFLFQGDAPVRMALPAVVTVLDLIPLKFPQLYARRGKRLKYTFARALERGAAKNAAGIITISEASKRDIVELLGISPERVAVTYLGVDARWSAPNDCTSARKDAERAQWNLPASRPMALYVGGIDPRKNVSFLFSIFETLKVIPVNQRPYLVLVGPYESDAEFPKLKQNIIDAGLHNDVILLGFIEDSQLLRLFHAADVFLFPSLYEGFGLPVLEAMASGLPVIAGKNSSLPEVAGDAAILLPDNDIQQWTSAFRELVQSRPEQERRRESGITRAKMFSWNATAQGTLTAYREFLLPSKSAVMIDQTQQRRAQA